jgi:hypothetical protein
MVGTRDLTDRVAVEMYVEAVHGGGHHFHHSALLSANGMQLNTAAPPPGTTVQLEFTLPGDRQPTWVLGEVVADAVEHRSGMLVRFRDVGERTQARLREFIERARRRAACETRELTMGERAAR